MLASNAARPRSATIIMARQRPRRSASAPACTPNSRLGSHTRAARKPIGAGPAGNVSTATSGSATEEIWSPNIEIVWPLQYRRNPVSRSSAGIRSVTRGHRPPPRPPSAPWPRPVPRPAPGLTPVAGPRSPGILTGARLTPGPAQGLLRGLLRRRVVDVVAPAGAGRPQLGPRCPVDVAAEEPVPPLTEFGQLGRRQVHEHVPEHRGPLPLGRLVRPGLQPAHHLLVVALGD